MPRTLYMNTFPILVVALCIFFLNPERSHAQAFSYDHYAKALVHVDEAGLVDYAALKADRASLDAFVTQLAQVTGAQLQQWQDEDKIAFWINAYNALTLQTVINVYPKIRKGVFYPAGIRTISRAWSTKHLVAGLKLTIPDIEHKQLRKNFNEANIHLAVICAALSCPPLRGEPFQAATLQAQFQDQLRRFISSGKAIKIDRKKNKVTVSKIFNWFGKDFKKYIQPKDGFRHLKGSKRSVMAFLHAGMNAEDKVYLRDSKYKVSYFGYDWSLNDQAALKKKNR